MPEDASKAGMIPGHETLQTTAMDGEGALPEPPPRRIVLDMPSWFPSERLPRGLLIALAALLVLTIIFGAAVPFFAGWVDQQDLESLSYPGIFLATLLGNATIFIPVPVLTAAGQSLIVAGPRALDLNPVGVVIAGAAGMTLGEVTAYVSGSVMRGVADERRVVLPGRAGEFLRRVAAWVDWLMHRYGFFTLLVLAGVPNPFFEFAGITAGAVRMNFWRFLTAVGIGKTVRVILLVIIGNALLDAFELWE